MRAPHPGAGDPSPAGLRVGGASVGGIAVFFSPLGVLSKCAWVWFSPFPKVTRGVLRPDFNMCQSVYKCPLVKSGWLSSERQARSPRGGRRGGRGKGARGGGGGGTGGREGEAAGAGRGDPRDYLLERHPQGAHVHVGRHPAGVQVAGGAQDDAYKGRPERSGEHPGRPEGAHRPPTTPPPPPSRPHPPLCIWFSCFRHLALRFWNQT